MRLGYGSAFRVIVFATVASFTPMAFLACASGGKSESEELSTDEGTGEDDAKKKHKKGKKAKKAKKKDASS